MCPTTCLPCFTSCTKRHLDKTITWAYDVGGNITSRKEYAFTTSTTTLGTPIKTYTYAYGSDWKDQLTSFDGTTCVYDLAGNPTTYKGNALTWEGRLLKTFTYSPFTFTMNYTVDGQRVSKVKSYYGGSTSHYYTYNGSTLVQEKIVTSGSQTTEYLTFLYNSEGPTGFVYNNTLYTYRKNIFGDIIAVYNGTSKVAEYAYDAYGNCTIVFATGNAGILNPFRYRGYYFDEDMKLYYLQSRYYDPETGRFINADDVSYLDPETIHGLNLYAYCLNNPVMYKKFMSGKNTKLGMSLKGLIGSIDYFPSHAINWDNNKFQIPIWASTFMTNADYCISVIPALRTLYQQVRYPGLKDLINIQASGGINGKLNTICSAIGYSFLAINIVLSAWSNFTNETLTAKQQWIGFGVDTAYTLLMFGIGYGVAAMVALIPGVGVFLAPFAVAAVTLIIDWANNKWGWLDGIKEWFDSL